MFFDNLISKVPWVLLFVVGVQFHFLAVIFPEIREFNIHVFGISVAVISAAFILIQYFVKHRKEEKISKMESLK